MTDTEQIQEQYRRMYDAMIRKDASGLDAVLDDSFVLIHMTGMRQPKPVFIQSVLDGTLNYFSAQHENMPVRVEGDRAELIGQSRVSAAVFGGGRHTWRLQQKITLKKADGVWRMTQAAASTY